MFISAGDIKLHTTVVGEGTRLVVVHGAVGLGASSMRDLDQWAGKFQLVYYDQRGSGETPLGDRAKVSFAGAIDDLDSLRRGLGIDRINLVGHSAGALLAALYAGKHPSSTASLVLLNAAPPLDPELQQAQARAMAVRRTAEDDAALQALAGQDLQGHTLNTFIPFFRDRTTISRVRLGFTGAIAPDVQAVGALMFGSLGALDPLGTLAGIRCPTLVVHSELDPVPVEWAHALVDIIPGADYVLLEDASHFAHVEDAAVLADAVLPWLSKHTGQAS